MKGFRYSLQAVRLKQVIENDSRIRVKDIKHISGKLIPLLTHLINDSSVIRSYPDISKNSYLNDKLYVLTCTLYSSTLAKRLTFEIMMFYLINYRKMAYKDLF